MSLFADHASIRQQIKSKPIVSLPHITGILSYSAKSQFFFVLQNYLVASFTLEKVKGSRNLASSSTIILFSPTITMV